MKPPRCTCGGYHAVKSTTLVLVEASEDCPEHGAALRKRSEDDWSAIMGATLPNQPENVEKGCATRAQ